MKAIMFPVDTTNATNYYSGVARFVFPRQDSNTGGDFFWLDDSPEDRQTTRGFNRCEACDKLFAPAHTFSQRPTLMRDRSKPDRQYCDEQTTPYAVLFSHDVGQPGRPDIACRAEAPSRATLPCLPSGRDTAASYLTQSGRRPIPVDPVGMGFGLGVVTADRVG